jgi:predicted nucleic acid-binding protein
MIWVVDASVAIKWFIVEETHPRADEVLERIIS